MFDVTPHGDVVTLGDLTWEGDYHHAVGQELTFTPVLRYFQTEVAEYFWDFGDGTYAVGDPDTGEATHTYTVANPGTIAHLRVTDAQGNRAFASMNLMLQGATAGHEVVHVTAPRTNLADAGATTGGNHNYDLTFVSPTFTITNPAFLTWLGTGWAPSVASYGIQSLFFNATQATGIGSAPIGAGNDLGLDLNYNFVDETGDMTCTITIRVAAPPGWTPPAAFSSVALTIEYWA